MDKALGEEKDKNVGAYIDDLVVYTQTLKEHLYVLARVFKRLIRHNIHLKAKKCKFLQTKILFLGLIFDKDGSRPDHAKIAPILDMSRPTNIKELRSFLG